MYLSPAIAINNGTLIGVACVVFIICAIFWLFGRR